MKGVFLQNSLTPKTLSNGSTSQLTHKRRPPDNPPVFTLLSLFFAEKPLEPTGRSVDAVFSLS